jgi:hypothetical protein
MESLNGWTVAEDSASFGLSQLPGWIQGPHTAQWFCHQGGSIMMPNGSLVAVSSILMLP